MTSPSPAAPRSTFVTMLAWTFIVLAGFAVVTSTFQVLLVVVMFTDAEIAASVASEPDMPEIARTLSTHIRMITLAFFILNTGTLVSAIGLLKRREWARKAFILVLVIGIVVLLGGMLLQYQLFSAVSALPAPGGPPVDAMFDVMMKILRIVYTLVGIVFSAIFGLIIAKLCSAGTRREFLG